MTTKGSTRKTGSTSGSKSKSGAGPTPQPAPAPDAPADSGQPVHIVVVLDRSGSMEDKRDETIGGFNAFLSDQQAEPGEATITLVRFNTQVETVYAVQPLASAPKLTRKTFVPMSDTALRDAVGLALVETQEYVATLPPDKQPRVIFVIVTDGEENASREISPRAVMKLIAEAKQAGWEFVFTATGEEAIQWAGAMGMPSGSTQTVPDSGAGMTTGFGKSSAGTTEFRHRGGRRPPTMHN